MCHKLHTPFCAQSIGKERNPVAAPTARRLGNVVLVWLGMCCAVLCLVTLLRLTLCDTTDCSPPRFSAHADSPGKNTGVGCHALLQGIFPTPGSNPGLLHCRQILNQLSFQGSPWLSTCLIKSFYYIRTDEILGDNIASVLVCSSGFSNVHGILSNKEKELACKGKIEESMWAETACWSGRPSEKNWCLN